MSENPYAPPTSEVEAPVWAQEGSGDFSIGQCLSDAWAATWASFPLWLGVMVMAGFALLLSGITIIGIFVVWPVLLYGGVRFLLRVHDGEAATDDVWSGFQSWGRVLAQGLALMFLMTLLGYVGQIPVLIGTFTENAVLIGVGYLVNLAWTFIMIRFYFAFFLWVEQDAQPVEALGSSWTMTGPVKWKMIGLVLVMGAIYLAAILPAALVFIPAFASESAAALFFGAVVAIALMLPTTMIGYLIFVSAYRQMAGRPERAH